MGLKEALNSGKCVITSEIGPLKGTDTSEIKEIGELFKGKVDAVNVTDQQSAVMRLGSLAACSILGGIGLDTVFQMTTRDRNRIALQSDLFNAHVLGIKNVLAITGDFPSLGDHVDAKDVYDLDVEQLIWCIMENLNKGRDLAGNELQGATDFTVGAAVRPVCDTEAGFELQLAMMEKKIKLGASFFQTQAVYDPDVFEKFMKRAGQFKVPVLAGIIPLRGVGAARYMNRNVSGVFVPEHLIDELKNAEDAAAKGIEITARLINDLKDLCQGVHIMAVRFEKKVPDILKLAKLI